MSVIDATHVEALKAQLAESEQQRLVSERRRLVVEQRVAALQLLNSQLEGQLAALQSALVNTTSEYETLKRRMLGVKSERSGTKELQLMLGDLLAERSSCSSSSTSSLSPSKS